MKNKEAKSIFSSLENYPSIPPPELWDKIEEQLDQPKKKKRIIIWWSIAASLLVGLSVPTIMFFDDNKGNTLELNVKNNTNEVVLQKDSNAKNNNQQNNKNDQKGNDNSNAIGNKNDNLNSNQVVTAPVLSISSKTKDSSKFKNLNQQSTTKMVQTAKNKSQSSAVVSNQKSTTIIQKSELPIIKSAQVSDSNSNKNLVVGLQNNDISEANKNKKIAENTISKSESTFEKTVQVNESNTNKSAIVSVQKSDISKANKNNEIVEKTSSKDSLGKIKTEVEQLENALVKSDSESVDKWSVQVFAGVMSSQNYSNGKVLGNTVDSKQSNGYGVKTNYKLNNKWGVSTGFKINELGQKIAGVSYYDKQQSLGVFAGSLPIANDNYVSNPSSNYQLVSISKNGEYLFSSNSKTEIGLEKGDVTQNLKYFEMPLEISYSLLSKKKTNISMNTGGFVGKLISNDISLNGNSIGENKNVNEYVYGTLLSSTLQYEVFKKTKFFIEPGMNYYINPLENQSFNQFQWMFNFGLNLAF